MFCRFVLFMFATFSQGERARKPPVTLKTTYQQSDDLQYYNVSNNIHGNIADGKKRRPFDVENLIKETVFSDFKIPNRDIKYEATNNNYNITQCGILNKNKADCVMLYPGTEILLHNGSFAANTEHSNISNTVCKTIVTMTSNSNTSTFTTCRNLDRSGEVKHAQTPINSSVQQSHSPQLPVSSPSYPIQTLLSSDFDCSKITIIESDKLIGNKLSSAMKDNYINNYSEAVCNKGVIQVPNRQSISCRNYANDDIHRRELRSTVSFWDLHLPYSTASTFNVQVEEREARSDITIKDLLSHTTKNNCNYDDKNRIQKLIGNNNEHSCFVLKVPAVNTHQPPFKRQKISKIDVAMRKRKQLRERRNLKVKSTNGNEVIKVKKERIGFERITTHNGTVTNFGVPVFGFSDSSSSSSWCSSDYESDSNDADACVNVKHNTLKLDFVQDKTQFLKLFGIITHRKRNDVELSKLERRKWQSQWIPPTEKLVKLVLDLPVPSITSPPTSSSFKVHFMHVLGLRSFPVNAKRGYEMDWLKVVQDRIKRNYAPSLTEYYLKVHQIYIKSIESIHNAEINKLNQLDHLSCKQKPFRKQKYMKYLKRPVIHNNALHETKCNYDDNGKCDNIKEVLFNNLSHYIKAEKVEGELLMDHQIAKREFNLDNCNSVSDNIISAGKFKLKQNAFDHSDLSYFNKCNVKNKFLRNEDIEELKLCNPIKEGDSLNIILRTPHVIKNSTNCKDITSRHSQTESNYVLPLTMVLVDNRSKIPPGTLTDHVSNSNVKINTLNKGTQCIITQDIISNTKNSNSKNEQTSDVSDSNEDTPKWPGLQKLVESYQLHSRDCDAEIKLLKESIKSWKETVSINLRQARTLERERRILQSTSYMFEQERMQTQKKIDDFNAIIDAFR